MYIWPPEQHITDYDGGPSDSEELPIKPNQRSMISGFTLLQVCV